MLSGVEEIFGVYCVKVASECTKFTAINSRQLLMPTASRIIDDVTLHRRFFSRINDNVGSFCRSRSPIMDKPGKVCTNFRLSLFFLRAPSCPSWLTSTGKGEREGGNIRKIFYQKEDLRGRGRKILLPLLISHHI